MKRIIEASVQVNHDGFKKVYDAYGIKKPVTPQTLAQALLKYGKPFLQDIDELVIGPCAKLINETPESHFSSFEGDEYSHFFKKIKSKLTAKREVKGEGSRRSTRQEKNENDNTTFKERRALKKEAKYYENLSKEKRQKGVAVDILKGAASQGLDIYEDVKNKEFDLFETGGNLFDMGMNWIEDLKPSPEYDESNQDTTRVTRLEKRLSQEEGPAKKNNIILYASLAAGVLVLIVAVVLMAKKK